MKKGLFPLIIGVVVAISLFWVGGHTQSNHYTSTDLPKKSFSKAPIELNNKEVFASTLNRSEVDRQEQVKTVTASKETDTANPDKGDFVQLADTFMQEAVQPTNEDYKVTEFDSKAQLVDHLGQYASKEIATYYVDGLYEEKADGLYIIPTELPPWVMKGEPAQLIQLDEQNYQLNQKNQTDLYGTYVIQLSFTKQNDQWIIQSVDVK
ncbi:hypothetical protein ACSVDE_12180 [Pseudalkalibacillus sp. Hm43]|uniref:hypothetical protein n=1 Tax=Pseudalkalibacillus sp. Hm43 TaxID=3450742 RepID=UPI003F41F929